MQLTTARLHFWSLVHSDTVSVVIKHTHHIKEYNRHFLRFLKDDPELPSGVKGRSPFASGQIRLSQVILSFETFF